MPTRIVHAEIIDRIHFAFDGGIAVAMYDLMFHNVDDAKPVSSAADTGTELGNQQAIGPKFAGLAADARGVTDGALADFAVMTDVVCEMACVAATFEMGDFVTIAENANGIQLENQKLKKTADAASRIGYAVKRYAANTTTVMVRLISRVVPHHFNNA